MSKNKSSWWHYEPLGPVIGKRMPWWKYQKIDNKQISRLHDGRIVGPPPIKSWPLLYGKFALPLLILFFVVLFLLGFIIK